MKFCEGDILNSGANIICHQVNCQGVMGSGLAKQIAEKYPEVKEKYIRECKSNNSGTYALLGNTQFILLDNGQIICNLFGQNNYGRDPKVVYTNYNALRKCFKVLGEYSFNILCSRIFKEFTIGNLKAEEALSILPFENKIVKYAICTKASDKVKNYEYRNLFNNIILISDILSVQAKDNLNISDNEKLFNYLQIHKPEKPYKISIAIPFNLGCGLGNGSWDIVLGIIENFEKNYNDFVDIQIWRL